MKNTTGPENDIAGVHFSNPVSAATTKHSPEPWTTGGSAYPRTIYSECVPMARTDNGDCLDWLPSKRNLFESTGQANAARIVACVNTLAGLNPEAVKDVVAELEMDSLWISNLIGDINAGRPLRSQRIKEGLTIRQEKIRAALAKLKGEAK
jgi:hypothetical protein